MSDYFVEVSEHVTAHDFVPFAPRKPIPGRMEVARCYGPYTEAGAERVARRALAQVPGEVQTYPQTGHRYVTDADGTRLVKIHQTPTCHLPFGWRSVIRNMPRDPRMLHCTEITPHHSEDTVKMYVGRTEPLMVCGYHASRLTSGAPEWQQLTEDRRPEQPKK